MVERNYVYDVYILNYSGIPLYGACTGSKFCQQNQNQHALHCGFFAALKSFCEEAFNQREIQLIEMPDIQVYLMAEPATAVMIAGVYPKSMKSRKPKRQIEAIMTRFIKKYADRLKPSTYVEDVFAGFTDDLVDLGIVPNRSVLMTRDVQFDKENQRINMPSLPE